MKGGRNSYATSTMTRPFDDPWLHQINGACSQPLYIRDTSAPKYWDVNPVIVCNAVFVSSVLTLTRYNIHHDAKSLIPLAGAPISQTSHT